MVRAPTAPSRPRELFDVFRRSRQQTVNIDNILVNVRNGQGHVSQVVVAAVVYGAGTFKMHTRMPDNGFGDLGFSFKDLSKLPRILIDGMCVAKYDVFPPGWWIWRPDTRDVSECVESFKLLVDSGYFQMPGTVFEYKDVVVTGAQGTDLLNALRFREGCLNHVDLVGQLRTSSASP